MPVTRPLMPSAGLNFLCTWLPRSISHTKSIAEPIDAMPNEHALYTMLHCP